MTVSGHCSQCLYFRWPVRGFAMWASNVSAAITCNVHLHGALVLFLLEQSHLCDAVTTPTMCMFAMQGQGSLMPHPVCRHDRPLPTRLGPEDGPFLYERMPRFQVRSFAHGSSCVKATSVSVLLCIARPRQSQNENWSTRALHRLTWLQMRFAT